MFNFFIDFSINFEDLFKKLKPEPELQLKFIQRQKIKKIEFLILLRYNL